MRRMGAGFWGIGILAAAIAAFLPSCGSGGGGVDVTPPTTNLEYVLAGPRAGTAPLTITGAGSEFTLASDLTERGLPWIEGRWDTDTLEATISEGLDNVIYWANTTAQGGGALFGDLSVVASEAFRWNGADNPTAGEFLIRSRNGSFAGTIRARVTSQGGAAGVLSRYDAGNDGEYESSSFSPWPEFADLWEGNSFPLYQRISSFVFYTRQAIFSVMDFSIEATRFVEDLRADLSAAGSGKAVLVDNVCGTPQGTPGQPGSFSVTWTDVNGNGQIDYDLSGAGLWDTFTFTTDQCWIDDPDDPQDFLLDGVMRLVYYEQNFQWSPAFDNFVVTPTRNGVAAPDSTTRYDGGFSVAMTTPAD